MSLPKLDTEEKLREYICKEWRGNYEPYQVDAFVINADSCLIKKSKETEMQNVPAYSVGRGRIVVTSERIVDPCVLPVLEEAYRKYDEKNKALSREAFIRGAEASAKLEAQKAEKRAMLMQNEIAQKKQDLAHPVHPEPPSLLSRILNSFK